MEDTFSSVINNNKISYISNIGINIGVIGQGISIYNNFQNNYSKCKYKNEDSAERDLLKTGINTAINLDFSHARKILGSFLPFSIGGSILGRIVRNYIGSYLNSQIKFDC